MGYKEGWRGAIEYLCGREDKEEEGVDVLGLLCWRSKRARSLLGERIGFN